MRWTKKYTRVVKRFALFPITINEETRWFENVYLMQRRDIHALIFRWYNDRFIDEAAYLSYKKEGF